MATVLRGSDNMDSLASQGIGTGQTRQDVTASRAVSTTYTNNTGRTIWVEFKGASSLSATGLATATVDGLACAQGLMSNSNGLSGGGVSFPVPAGKTYSIATVWSAGTPSFTWVELR